jgi:CO dehydrogenase maturation factor
LLGELDGNERVLICDLEAGLGTVLRMQAGHADVVLVVAEPTAKSIEVAKRAARIAEAREVPVLVVANRVREDQDLEAISAAFGGREIAVVPEEPAITHADREGLAPIDLDADAPGVRAITSLRDRLAFAAAR